VEASRALSIADGLERLGDFGRGIAILERSRDHLERSYRYWVLSRLARLYGKAGQFDHCLDVVQDSLSGQVDDQQVEELAEIVTHFAGGAAGGEEAVRQFIGQLGADKRRQIRRFVTAVQRRTPAVEQEALPSPVRSLIKGVQVQPPRNARNMRQFLEMLAEQAHTLTTQSFMEYAENMPAPTVEPGGRSAYEILAEAISGTVAAFEMTPEGYWALFEGSEPRYYASGGGVLFTVSRWSKVEPEATLSLKGKLHYELSPSIIAHEAWPASRGGSPIWLTPQMGPVDLFFTRQEVEGRPPRWVSQARLAVATAWTELEVPSLDFKESWRTEKDGVTMVVEPPTIIPSQEGDSWQIPVQLSGFSNVPSDIKGSMFLGEVELRLADGQRLRPRGMRGSVKRMTMEMSPLPGADPKITALIARVPTRVVILEVPLELYNVPSAGATSPVEQTKEVQSDDSSATVPPR